MVLVSIIFFIFFSDKGLKDNVKKEKRMKEIAKIDYIKPNMEFVEKNLIKTNENTESQRIVIEKANANIISNEELAITQSKYINTYEGLFYVFPKELPQEVTDLE